MIAGAGVNARIRPILITASADWTHDDAGYRVPKRELASVVGVLLQSGRLELPETLPERAVLVRELQQFKAKITTSGNETFEAGADWRTKPHDDMVLGLGIAAWLGEREPPPDDGARPFAFGGTPPLRQTRFGT